jgi:hypothetical protein
MPKTSCGFGFPTYPIGFFWVVAVVFLPTDHIFSMTPQSTCVLFIFVKEQKDR